MFLHCNKKFNSFEIWFLQDNKDFERRKLYLGECPVCGASIVELVETRKYDGAFFRKTFYKKDADKVTQKMILQVEYTNHDIKRLKKVLFGFCYGENKEIHNSKGEVISIKQKRCDYFGNKEVILKIKTA